MFAATAAAVLAADYYIQITLLQPSLVKSEDVPNKSTVCTRTVYGQVLDMVESI